MNKPISYSLREALIELKIADTLRHVVIKLNDISNSFGVGINHLDDTIVLVYDTNWAWRHTEDFNMDDMLEGVYTIEEIKLNSHLQDDKFDVEEIFKRFNNIIKTTLQEEISLRQQVIQHH